MSRPPESLPPGPGGPALREFQAPDALVAQMVRVAAVGSAVVAGLIALMKYRDPASGAFDVVLHLVISALGLLAAVLLRRLGTQVAAHLLIWSLWVLMTVALVRNGGVRGPSVLNYPMLVVFSGWVTGLRPTLVLGAMSAAVLVTGTFGQERGWFAPARYGEPLLHAIYLVGVLVLTLSATLLSRRDYLRRVADIERLAQDLARREQELRRFHLAVEQSPIGTMMLDAQGRVDYVNPAYAEITGFARDAVIGQPPAALDPGADPLRGALQQVLAQGRHWKGERAARHANGHPYPELDILAPIRQEDGRISHALLLLQDLSAQKQAEAELARARDHLEELVRVRTAQLDTARQAAEAASLAKADFLAHMSHEIRTPMNAIIGMTHLALRTGLNAQQQDYLDKIRASGTHLLGIINDILDFSKIEAGRLDIEQTVFETEDVLAEATAQIAERAAEKGLELVVELDPAVPPRLRGDPLRIRQVLLNYLTNAVKFTEHGQVVVAMRPETGASGECWLRTTVTDTGIGITAAQRAQLFQSFRQAGVDTSRRYGGTGLGLAISQRLAQLMGGEVGVDSTPGEGSAFWFTVRVDRPEDDAPPTAALPHGTRVLVIEPQARTRRALQTLLESLGAAVQVAGSAAEVRALRAAGVDPVDAVLVNASLPDAPGLDTVQALMADARPPAVLLLVPPGDAGPTRAAALAAGASGVLPKPLLPGAVRLALTAALAARATLRPAPADVSAGRTDPPVGTGTVPGAPPVSPARLEGAAGLRAGARVLVVEDNLLNQEVALALLEAFGIQAHLAVNGQEAVDQVLAQPWDLVLMDMQMPVLDGLDATRAIRRNPAHAALPIVAMTANAMASDRQRCLDVGMNDFVPKPVDPDQLLAVLRRWIPAGPGR